jgi:hypothetical protein
VAGEDEVILVILDLGVVKGREDGEGGRDGGRGSGRP